MKKIISIFLLIGLIGCISDAERASYNLSKDADQFRVLRRVVFYNGITDKYILSIEGLCSINSSQGQLQVTCKTDTGYIKHFLGLSNNVTYFAEQLRSKNVSATHYKVIFKPLSIIPDIDIVK